MAKYTKDVINVAPPDERIYDYPIDLLKLLVVNEPEAMALAQQTDVTSAFDTLCAKYPNTHIVILLVLFRRFA